MKEIDGGDKLNDKTGAGVAGGEGVAGAISTAPPVTITYPIGIFQPQAIYCGVFVQGGEDGVA